ncbi:hypothetical protein ILYODFUR_007760 [Ilyodon furcidens]|uniref:Uncharacterized protein n=2 Tax=Goodeidae TaxID=28758 RepID=A0ABU7BM46_9TELE|nr:hypothetical protein [Ataeniobius toweri]
MNTPSSRRGRRTCSRPGRRPGSFFFQQQEEDHSFTLKAELTPQRAGELLQTDLQHALQKNTSKPDQRQ